MNRSTSSALRAVSTVACIILSAAMAHAQYRASLRGTVSDPQGAVIAGATVTLVNTDTNHVMVSTSDGNGIYIFNALPPAPYRLTVEHQGFTKKVLEHVQIIPEQLNALDLQLEVGQVSQTVTVSSTSQALDTETATVELYDHQQPDPAHAVIQSRRVSTRATDAGSFRGCFAGRWRRFLQLAGKPRTGRNFVAVRAAFSRRRTAPRSKVAAVSIETNSITVDGISTVSAVWGGTSIITPSEDSVGDMKVSFQQLRCRERPLQRRADPGHFEERQ